MALKKFFNSLFNSPNFRKKEAAGLSFDELLKRTNALTGQIRRAGWADKTCFLEFHRPDAYEARPEAIRFFMCTFRSGLRTRYYFMAEDVAATDWNFIEENEVF